MVQRCGPGLGKPLSDREEKGRGADGGVVPAAPAARPECRVSLSGLAMQGARGAQPTMGGGSEEGSPGWGLEEEGLAGWCPRCSGDPLQDTDSGLRSPCEMGPRVAVEGNLEAAQGSPALSSYRLGPVPVGTVLRISDEFRPQPLSLSVTPGTGHR